MKLVIERRRKYPNTGAGEEGVRAGLVYGRGGYTILEMIIGIALFGIVGTLIHFAYNTASHSYHMGENRAVVLQNTRSALAILSEEIRQAGYNITPTQSPITLAQSDQIRFNADISSTVVNSLTQEPAEDIVILLEKPEILRSEGGGDEIEVAFGVSDLTFDYLNSNGASLIDTTLVPSAVPQCYLSQINVITLSLTVESADSASSRYHQSMTISSSIKPRNLKLSELPYYADIDTVPPDPVPVTAEDLRKCDKIYVSWMGYDEDAQGDVQGYHLFIEDYYYNNVGSLSSYATHPTGVKGDTIRGLDTLTPYYISVTAFDEIPNENHSVDPVSESPTCPPDVDIFITSPAHLDTCVGHVVFTADVVDSNSEVYSVKFRIKGTENSEYTDMGEPYRYNGDSGLWNTSEFTDGDYVLVATARDFAGISLAADSIDVLVLNEMCPYPPSVTITSPENGETIAGDVYFTANASDYDGSVSYVDFYIDDDFEYRDTADPYYCFGDYIYWNTASGADGEYSLYAIAYDDNGCSNADTITVYINNGGGELLIDRSYPVTASGLYDQEWAYGIYSTSTSPIVIKKLTATWDKEGGRLHRIEIPAGTEVWEAGSVGQSATSGTTVDLSAYPVISPLGNSDVKLFFWHKDSDSNPGGRENCPMGGAETTQEFGTSLGDFGPYYVYFPCNLNIGNLWLEHQCSISTYEFAYLEEGDEYFVDRSYVLEDIPDKYEGLLWLRTANDDKDCSGGFRIHLSSGTPFTMYLGYDPRDTPSNWVVNNMVDTGDSLLISDSNQEYFRIWEAYRTKGHYWLPPNKDGGAGPGIESMYVILFRCKE